MINTNINITENIVNEIGSVDIGINRYGQSLPILLKALKLPVINDLHESYATKADVDGWGYTKYLSKLCEHELEVRHTKQIETYLKQANLPSGKSITNFEFGHLPNLTKSRVNDLVLSSKWVRSAENVLIFGPSGVGKTHLAAAIGHSLIEKQIRVLFTSTTKLVQNLQICNKDHKLSAALAKLDKYEVIILDDIGYVKKDSAETYVLFELIASRYESGSLVITSNYAFSEWNNIFATNSMTVAAIDRLVHHARIFEISTESYRRKHALEQQALQHALEVQEVQEIHSTEKIVQTVANKTQAVISSVIDTSTNIETLTAAVDQDIIGRGTEQDAAQDTEHNIEHDTEHDTEHDLVVEDIATAPTPTPGSESGEIDSKEANNKESH